MLKDRKYGHAIVLIFANVLAWSSFISILFLTNPKSAGTFGAVILCLSLFLGLIGTFLLLWQLKILRKK